ncbi:hypothetical protein U1839_24580 [Sphingomonas sp. RT2P30]|uniref:hypothetical protein n=1 Tax=Parasphingomonas halimpatiens TaxID=3096162 RepID=UPI002FC9C4C5
MSNDESAASKWQIYRLELIFLNPEQYRWQVFQHWPTKDGEIQPLAKSEPGETAGPDATTEAEPYPKEAMYRRYAEQLLGWVYDAVADDFDPPDGLEPIEIDTAAIWRAMYRRIEGATRPERVGRLLKSIEDSCARIRKICKEEDIGLEHVELLSKIRPNGPKVSLSPRTARGLISALYVAHYWDVWGRLAFPPERERAKGERPNEPAINPARLSSFSYVIHYPKDRPANNILGYEVDLMCAAGTRVPARNPAKRVQADWVAVAESRAKFGSLGEYGDYFSQCHDIKDVQHDAYRLYGYLLDEVAKEVAGEETLFFRCFPLRICGYDHFIQILLKPPSSNPPPPSIDDRGVDVPAVFSNPVAATKGRPLPSLLVLKECLREMIVQMHIAEFQRVVLLKLNAATGQMLRDQKWKAELFAQHAPNLVRMERLWVDGHAYTYLPDKFGFKKWRKVNEGKPGWQPWKPERVDERYLEFGNATFRAFIPWEADFKSLAPLLGGTGKMRLEEQWFWLRGAVRRRLALSRLSDAHASERA